MKILRHRADMPDGFNLRLVIPGCEGYCSDFFQHGAAGGLDRAAFDLVAHRVGVHHQAAILRHHRAHQPHRAAFAGTSEPNFIRIA